MKAVIGLYDERTAKVEVFIAALSGSSCILLQFYRTTFYGSYPSPKFGVCYQHAVYVSSLYLIPS